MVTPTHISSLTGILPGPYDCVAMVYKPGHYPTDLVAEFVRSISEYYPGIVQKVNNKMFKVWSGGPTLVICSSGSMALRGRSLNSVILVDVPQKHLDNFYTMIYPAMSVYHSQIYVYEPEPEKEIV
jgi:hypothetical protein